MAPWCHEWLWASGYGMSGSVLANPLVVSTSIRAGAQLAQQQNAPANQAAVVTAQAQPQAQVANGSAASTTAYLQQQQQ